MEIQHAARMENGRPTNQIFQLARLVCPKCHEAVEYILPQDDISYKAESQFLKKRCDYLEQEYERLMTIIHEMGDLIPD